MRSMWRGGLWIVVLAWPGPGHATADDKPQKAEVEWAKRVATQFFASALALPSDDDLAGNPVTFLGPELAAEIKAKDSVGSTLKLAWQYQGGHFHVISSEMSPSGTEVVLTGELVPLPREEREKRFKQQFAAFDKLEVLGRTFVFNTADFRSLGPRRDRPADMSVWLAKDGQGRWTVRYIQAKVRDAPGGTPGKAGTFTIVHEKPAGTIHITQGDVAPVQLGIRRDNYGADVKVEANVAVGPAGVRKDDIPKSLRLDLEPKVFPGNRHDQKLILTIGVTADAPVGDYAVQVKGTPAKEGDRASKPLEIKVRVKARRR